MARGREGKKEGRKGEGGGGGLALDRRVNYTGGEE